MFLFVGKEFLVLKIGWSMEKEKEEEYFFFFFYRSMENCLNFDLFFSFLYIG